MGTEPTIQIRDHKDILDYLRTIRRSFQYIDFTAAGLDDRERSIDKPNSDHLYVLPDFCAQYIDPQTPVANWPETVGFYDLLRDHKRLFILGDPGIGKTTLVRRIAYILARGPGKQMEKEFGQLVPVPITLRELSLAGVEDWDSLLRSFTKQAWIKDSALSVARLHELAEKGQLLFLFDGLDEITNADSRQKLAKIIREGLKKYPATYAWVTSRIVGFDQALFWHPEYTSSAYKLMDSLADPEFDKPIDPVSGKDSVQLFREKFRSEKGFRRKLIEKSLIYEGDSYEEWPQFYIAPFSDDQIAKYMRQWQLLYEPEPTEREKGVERFLRGLTLNTRIQHLARIPIMLNMMALYLQLNKVFPDGRAELYRSITRAFLDKLSRLKDIPPRHQLSPRLQILGLAAIALKMQEDRAGDDAADQRLSISRPEAIDLFAKELAKENETGDLEEKAAAFFDHVDRRGAILVPRIEGEEYSFLHLSYQEFLAAQALHTEQARAEEAEIEEAFWANLRSKCAHSHWRETLILYFETFLVDVFNPRKSECRRACKKLLGKAEDIANGVVAETAFAVRANALIRTAFNEPKTLHFLDTLFLRYAYALANENSVAGASNYFYLISNPEENLPAQCRYLKVTLDDLTKIVDIAKSLPDLVYLDLSWTQVSGELSQLTPLTQLQSLGLDSTQVSGELSQLTPLTQLQSLGLDSTQVSGELSQLTPLTQLQSLGLDSTQVSGELSQLTPLTQLQSLWLSSTQVSGELSQLTPLTQLQSLWLSSTQVSGELSQLTPLTQLQYLWLDSTQVNGELSQLTPLTQLQYLRLSSTQVSGELSQLTPLTQLQSLWLDSTQVSGELSQLTPLTQLQYLWLDSTQVNGELSQLTPLTQLQYLRLSSTQVSGELSQLTPLTQLQSLWLDSTQVSGELSQLTPLTQLQSLNLDSTQVSGELSQLTPLTQLQSLGLSSTQVSGELSQLTPLTQLQSLRLSSTQVSGELSQLRPLTQLQFLYLASTRVHGELMQLRPLTQLQSLWLSWTQVSGELSQLTPLIQLQSLGLDSTQVSGELSQLTPLTQLQSLNLDSTQVSGELSQLTPLTQLQFLSLDSTQVSGELSQLTPLTQLQTLYLVSTQVSGEGRETLLQDLPNLEINMEAEENSELP